MTFAYIFILIILIPFHLFCIRQSQ